MAWAWRQNLAMDWLHTGWQKNYIKTHSRYNGGSVARCCKHRGRAWL